MHFVHSLGQRIKHSIKREVVTIILPVGETLSPSNNHQINELTNKIVKRKQNLTTELYGSRSFAPVSYVTAIQLYILFSFKLIGFNFHFLSFTQFSPLYVDVGIYCSNIRFKYVHLK